jgi:broad specificity phosphatase PhoE
MDSHLPVIYIARHGETAWTLTGQHTGLTDLPLTPQGERNARGLTTRLADLTFAQVFTSRLHAQVKARADSVLRRVRAVKVDVLLFSSGHFIRVLAARWIGLEPSVNSMSFLLSTASLSAVGYDHDVSRPVIRLWNDTHHVHTNGFN